MSDRLGHIEQLEMTKSALLSQRDEICKKLNEIDKQIEECDQYIYDYVEPGGGPLRHGVIKHVNRWKTTKTFVIGTRMHPNPSYTLSIVTGVYIPRKYLCDLTEEEALYLKDYEGIEWKV